jgi:cytochrome c oxidase assembly protein subunit 15
MPMRPDQPAPSPSAIANWLFAVAALVLAMIVVGGITRLTESGLSIVRWEPVSGILPPLGEAQWQAEFDLYRATPQYQLVNRGMSLAEFRNIYFWEYVHRLLGRLIGLAFALPLLWLWWRRAIPEGQGRRLLGLFALGALQGAIGWWMVASGLVDRPEVSHIRLAVHLLIAFAIFGALIWVALDHVRLARSPEQPPARMPTLAIWALSLLFLQFLFGAYVAGLEAGYAYNTWPKMGDEWFPADTPMEGGLLANLADNPILVQFVHRWLAFVVAGVVLALVSVVWTSGRRGTAAALFAALFIQIQLGILTLLSGVEIELGVAHQAMAALLLAATVVAAHKLGEKLP